MARMAASAWAGTTSVPPTMVTVGALPPAGIRPSTRLISAAVRLSRVDPVVNSSGPLSTIWAPASIVGRLVVPVSSTA